MRNRDPCGMKCEKEVLITKACSTLVAHIGEEQMIKQSAKSGIEKIQNLLNNRGISIIKNQIKNDYTKLKHSQSCIKIEIKEPGRKK